MFEPTCCNKDNLQETWTKETEWTWNRCLCSGSKETIWDSLEFLLAQFIGCSADSEFDPEHPRKSKCSGCAYEIEEILNRVWHLTQTNRDTEDHSEWRTLGLAGAYQHMFWMVGWFCSTHCHGMWQSIGCLANGLPTTIQDAALVCVDVAVFGMAGIIGSIGW